MQEEQKIRAELLEQSSAFPSRIVQFEQAEKAPRESEGKWHFLLKNTTDVVLNLDREGAILFIHCILPGYTIEDTIGKTVYDFIPPKQHEKMRKAIEEVFKTGEVVSFETSEFGSYGSPLRYSTRLSPVKNCDKVVCVAQVLTNITKCKKVEERIGMFSDAVAGAVNGIAIVDMKGKITYANSAMEKIYGYEKGELLGKPFSVLNPDPETTPLIISIVKKMETWKGEIVQIKRNKETFPALVSLSVIRDKKENQTAIMANIRDMTEYKMRVKELRDSEYRFRTIFDNAADGIILVDVESKKLHSGNKPFCQMLGFNPEEIKNLGVMDIHPEKDLPHVIEEFEKQLRGEFTLSSDIPVKRKDGSVFYADINSFPIILSGKRYLLGIFRDITERKRAEEAMRDSESKYRTLVENIPQKIFLKDKNSVYVSCNENLAKDFKIKPEEIVGKTDYDLVPNELAEKYRADDKRIIKSGETEAVEEKYLQQGKERIIHTVKTPVKDEQGKVIGVLGIFWDITELTQAQEELSKYREKMARAEQLASLGILSATVAHELTQPLTVLHLLIENALEKLEITSSPETVTEKLKDSLDEISIITSTIERFRDFARRSSEQIFQEVDLEAVGKRIVKLLYESARRARIALCLKDMDELPPVYSNEKDMEQLFFTLVDNAIQASDRTRERRIIISGAVKNGHIELRFSDDCGGIARENLDRIYEPFFTTKPAGEGTGLGLCIVRRIVSRAGGKVRVESKFGKGSTFFVTLPTNKSTRSSLSCNDK